MTELSVAEVLERAADLIEPEGAWTRHVLYRDAAGNPAGTSEGGPVCWCALGAIMHVGYYGEYGVTLVERDLPEAKGSGLRPLSAWNDAPERTQAEVVAKLREAAALAREQSL